MDRTIQNPNETRRERFFSGKAMTNQALAERGQKIKLRLEQFPEFDTVLELLDAVCADREAYVVGGAIRDALLGQPIKDIDFLIPKVSLQKLIIRIPKNIGTLTYGPLGSARWKLGNDKYFDLVAIEDVRHGFDNSKDLNDALQKWDITINAIAFNPLANEIADCASSLEGLKDLVYQKIRAIRFDVPEQKIFPDSKLTWRASLWFRIVHRASTLGFLLDFDTSRWVENNMSLLLLRTEFEQYFFDPKLEVLERIGKDL